MKVRIYDMDGTIVCSLHRYRVIDNKIDLKFWRDNEYKAYDDSLLPLHDQYVKDINNPDVYVVIATARVLHKEDYRFINDKLGKPNHIISRKDSDYRSGGLLKVLGLKKLLSLKQFRDCNDVIFYEDNANYLNAVCEYFSNIKGVFVPSKQGH